MARPKKKTSPDVLGFQSNKGKGYNDEEFRGVCSAVRTLYAANRKIPTLDEIDAVSNISRGKIAKIVSQESFLQTMDITGVPMRKSKGLTAQQHYALWIMTDPSGSRNFDARLKTAGITSTMWRNWLKNPLFHSFVETFLGNALQDHKASAHMSLMNQVDRGNMTAIQFYYQMTGIYDPTNKVERDIQSVLSAVVDIIQRNVTDQAALQSIATELGELMGQKQRPALPATRDVVDAEVVNDTPFDTMVSMDYSETNYGSPDQPVPSKEMSLEEKLDAGIAAVPRTLEEKKKSAPFIAPEELSFLKSPFD